MVGEEAKASGQTHFWMSWYWPPNIVICRMSRADAVRQFSPICEPGLREDGAWEQTLTAEKTTAGPQFRSRGNRSYPNTSVRRPTKLPETGRCAQTSLTGTRTAGLRLTQILDETSLGGALGRSVDKNQSRKTEEREVGSRLE